MIQDKIFFDEKDPTGLSYNTPFTFYGSYQGRLWSKAPGGEIKYYTQNSDLSVYATTGSNQFNGNQAITGSLTVTGGIIGTAATSSYVEYSNVANKPTLVSGSSQVSFSGITNKPTLVSGSSQVSFNGITNKPTLVSGSAQVAQFGYAITGSNQFKASQAITGSLVVTQQIVAQTLNVQQVTSSIVYSSGSNVFGNSLSNTQQFTGSVSITGSLNTSIAAFGSAATVFLTSDSGTIKSRTAAQTLSDIAALPLAGGTLTGDLSISYTTANLRLFLNNTTATTGRSWYFNSYNNGNLYVGNTTAGDIFNFSSTGAATFTGALNGTSATFSSTIISNVSTNALNIGNSQNSTIALSTFGKTSTSGYATANNYLQIGAGENATNSTRLIGFGYSITANTNQPAYIGYIETSNTGETKGSLIFGTRDVTTDTAPTTRLTIASTGAATFSNSVSGNALRLFTSYASGRALNFGFSDGSVLPTAAFYIGNQTAVGVYIGDETTTNGLYVKANGLVGIGTASPVDALVVSGENKLISFEPAGDASFCGIRWSKNVAGGNVTAASIIGTTEGNFGRRGIAFSTGNFANFTDNAVERMRITAGGIIQIQGQTTNQGIVLRNHTTADRYHIFVGGGTSGYIVDDCYVLADNTDYHIKNNGGGVKLSNGATSWVADSDIRLKDKVSDIDNAIEIISQLETLKFTWKRDSELENKPVYFGLVAQNAKEIMPEVVDTGRDEMQTLGIRYTEVIPILVKAIQELKTEIDSLKNQIK